MRASIAALLVTIVLAASATPSGAQTASSSALLLSPHISLNETFVWRVRLYSSASQSQPATFVSDHTDVITCTALTQEGDAFVMSRRVKVMFPPTPKATATSSPEIRAALRDLGLSNPKSTVIEPKPSYIVQRGVDLSTGWRPLNADPICRFYSIPMYGAPPAMITVGTSWHFNRPWYDCPACIGTTTVTSLDLVRRTVGLRVELPLSQDDKNPMVTTLSIIDGGVIAVGSDRVDAENETSTDGPPWRPGFRNDFSLLSAGT